MRDVELMNKILKTYCLLICLLMTFLMGKDRLPVSRQATVLESTSPAEVMVRATGIGIGEKKGLFDKVTAEELNQNAENDAAKAAVWHLLTSSASPILQTGEEKAKFEQIQQDFFRKDNINNFI